MIKKWLVGILLVLVIASTLLASCTSNTTSSTTTSSPQGTTSAQSSTTAQTSSVSVSTTMASTATRANWWDKFGTPQYGGTLTLRASDLSSLLFDPGAGGGLGQNPYLYSYESLSGIDWALDRNTFSFKIDYTPEEYSKGVLAKSWETTDPTTITFHLRQGIKWQNKAPVNGREFTSEDILYNVDRIFGTGHGFTVANPMLSHFENLIDRVIAVDKYTIQVKIKDSSLSARNQAFGLGAFAPSEAVESAGGSAAGIDWKNVVGTGPWLLTDFVAGSTLTQSTNPDYWGTDERFPQNKIPYLDMIKTISIPDKTTAEAALRTGKIDMMPYMFSGLTIQDGQTLAKSDPDIQQSLMPQAGPDIELRCDKAPYTDIRVRQALNMALDRNAIAKSHYLGVVDGTPAGYISPLNTLYATPFSEWPSDVQAIYTYNTVKAKQLLADAGYPNGFKTECVAPNDNDIDLLQIIKAEFADIGVQMDINVMDRVTYMNYVNAGKQDQMCYQSWIALPMPPDVPLSNRYSKFPSPGNTFNKDAQYDAMFEQFSSSTTVAQAVPLFKQAEMYALEQSWSVNVFSPSYPIAWQPYVKGFSGENMNHPLPAAQIVSRLWIDSSLVNTK